jgi:hypothetical protein
MPKPKFSQQAGIAFLLPLIVLTLLATATGVTVVRVQNTKNRPSTPPSPDTSQASTQNQPAEQVVTNPSDGKQLTINQNDYYSVEINKQTYYGKVTNINQDYIRLAPTVYRKANTLTVSGKELHGPEPATFFRKDKLTSLRKLNSGNQTDKAITDLLKSIDSETEGYLTSQTNRYLKPAQFQAFFFSDGSAFFARVTTLDGNFLAALPRVYRLQAANGNSPTGPTSPQVSLAAAPLESYRNRTANELLYWQNMMIDSQIAKAATDFENN